jgi:hypothetical protein
MTWTPGPWFWNDSANLDRLMGSAGDGGHEAILAHDNDSYVGPIAPGNARLIAHSPDLVASLEEVVGWLEGTEAFEQSHGAHTAAVEARKLLARVKGE